MPRLQGLNSPRWGGVSTNTVLFYGVVPALFGVVFAGLTHPQLSAAEWPVSLVQIYSVAVVLCGWVIRDLCSAAVARVLRPRGASLTAVLIGGALVATIFVFPFSITLQTVFEIALVPELLRVAHTRWEPLLPLDPAFVTDAIVNHILPSLFLWTATSLLFFHVLGMPRYGYPRSAVFDALNTGDDAVDELGTAGTPGATAETRQPAFMTLLPADRRTERIIALKAEQHYVRIYTAKGENLIHEKFRSAILEFERCGGLQVHRSYAVNPAFMTEVASADGTYQITMANGLTVPVSRSHIAVVRRLAGSLSTAVQQTA